MSTCSKNGDRVRCAREEPKRLTQRSGKSKRKISKIDFICTNLCVYIYNQSIEDSINFDLKNKSFLFDE